jgi:hypothetical protein
MVRASESPNGDELRKFLLDFDCAGLCADSGKAFIKYAKGTAVCDNRDTNTPALSPKLENIFLGWEQANDTNDEVSERKSVYLDCLRNRCRYSRDVFGCRVILNILEIWQELAAPYIPEQVAKAKAHGFNVCIPPLDHGAKYTQLINVLRISTMGLSMPQILWSSRAQRLLPKNRLLTKRQKTRRSPKAEERTPRLSTTRRSKRTSFFVIRWANRWPKNRPIKNHLQKKPVTALSLLLLTDSREPMNFRPT